MRDFDVLVNKDGHQVIVTFPLVEANVHFETMRANGAAWTVLDGPGQWNEVAR